MGRQTQGCREACLRRAALIVGSQLGGWSRETHCPLSPAVHHRTLLALVISLRLWLIRSCIPTSCWDRVCHPTEEGRPRLLRWRKCRGGRAVTQRQLAGKQPGPNTAVERDGPVSLRIGPQGAMGLPVATICAAAISHLEGRGVQLMGDSNLGSGTWRLTPTAGNRLQPPSFQVR